MDEQAAKAQLATISTPTIPTYITTSTEYVSAAELLRVVKGEQQRLKTLKDNTLAPFREGMQRVQALFAPKATMLDEAEADLKEAIGDWTERQRLEQRRLEAELRDQHTRDAAAAEARAERLAEKGKEEQAEAVRESVPAVPVVIMDTPKVSGVSTRPVYTAEVVDFMELVKAVANGTASPAYLTANMTVLNNMARAMKESGSIPGVRMRRTTSVAARGA
jgi:hypothetical protein